MDAIQTFLKGRPPSSSHQPRFIFRQRAKRSGLGEEHEEERGEESQAEMTPVHPESAEDLNSSLSGDVTALVLHKPVSRRKAVFYLTLFSLLIFTTAFLLGYVVFRALCHYCGETDMELGPVDDTCGSHYDASESMMDLGELKDMLRKYLFIQRGFWFYNFLC